MGNQKFASTLFSEETPLTKEGRKDNAESSVMFRRLSPRHQFISRVKKAISAFENEMVAAEVDFDEDKGSLSLSSNKDGAKSASSNNIQRRRYQKFCGKILFVSLVLSFVAIFFLNHISSTSQESTSCLDPIKALEKESSLGNLRNAVASDHEACSLIGKSVLMDGGNAVDSAVATVLCLGVANPASSGLGGGAFILIHSDSANFESRTREGNSTLFQDKRDAPIYEDNGKITEVIDCRESAPAAATQDMFASTPAAASSFGGLAVAIPGELRGLELAHSRHGKLPWKVLVNPAIEMAENGVPVSKHLATDIQEAAETKTKKYGEFPRLRSYLTDKDNWQTYLKEGQLLKNPELAKTLRLIAEFGSDGLYTGEVAKKLVEDVATEGGILSLNDMQKYLPTLRSPLVGSANGFTLVGVPPPSSGGATLIGAARFLSGYKTPLASAPDTLSIHRTVEALRHAFAIRMSLSDPDIYKNITASAIQDLVTGDYMKKLRHMTLDNDTLPLSMYGGKKWAQFYDSDGDKEIVKDAHEGDRRRLRRNKRHLARPFGYLEDSGTSHLSVVDQDGNAISITSSVNQIFGSYVFSNSTGILMGNTMDDFGNPGRSNYYGLKPSKENFIAPGKKPVSSMSPTMVFRKSKNSNYGKLALVIGGSGGPKIISSVLQVIINYCFLGMTLFDAIARPRIHEQLLYHDAAVTTTENDMLDQGPLLEVPQRTKDALLRRGHSRLLDIDYAGSVQAVSLDLETNSVSAVSDIRKGGKPAGY